MMIGHFRFCPKHKLPLPCAHCALAAQPSTSVSVAVLEPAEPLPVPEEPVTLPNETVVLLNEPLPVPMEPTPEPSETRLNTGDSASAKNKGGRPRKYPVGTTAATRMGNVHREQRHAAKEQKRIEEISKTAKEQEAEVKDTSGQVRGPGKYMPGAEKGKGELLNVNNLERTEGWSQLNDLYGSAGALDAATAAEFEAKLGEAFSKNPELAACFGDLSLDGIHDTLRKYMTTGLKSETGHKGRVVAQGAGVKTEDNVIKVFNNEYPVSPARFVVRLTEGECTEINDCLRRLRDDEEFCLWVESQDKNGYVSGHYQCQLCKQNLGWGTAWLIGQHFVQEHTKEARRFFKDEGVPFRAGYLGVLNGKKPKK
jgi:hypothetical protein